MSIFSGLVIVSDSFSDPMACSVPASSVHGIFPAILEWVAMPSSGDLPDPRFELRAPALQADSLPQNQGGSPRPSLGVI